MKYLSLIVTNLGSNDQNLIFAPTVPTARNIALSLEGDKNGEVEELVNYYKETVRENYALCQALNRGVAYNHGRLPMHVRRTIEKAISNKLVSNVVCTTTLLQGVNLPAQNIFIRNPHLYIKKNGQDKELTNYEMANLRGRAGRLLKDFVGRTFVLDENSFGETEGYEQEELFDNPEKELPTGFGEQYENYTAEIVDDYNIYGISDLDSTPANKAQNEDDFARADSYLSVKTGEVFIYISVVITTIILIGIGVFIIILKSKSKLSEGGV